jgi:hypothetical protein
MMSAAVGAARRLHGRRASDRSGALSSSVFEQVRSHKIAVYQEIS